MRLVLTIFMILFVTSCVPAVVGGVASGGKILSQDRTVGEAVSDGTIWTKIRAGFIGNNLDSLVGSVNVTVSEGRVLLTGHVKDDDTLIKIIRVCWDQDGVNEVINELRVDDRKDKNFSEYAKDSWITTRIKAKLLITRHIKSVNYTVETIKQVVYIMGIARTQEELDTVTDTAATVSGVEKVVSYVKIIGSLDSRVDKTKGLGAGSASTSYHYEDKPAPIEPLAPMSISEPNKVEIKPEPLEEKHIGSEGKVADAHSNSVKDSVAEKSTVPAESKKSWRDDEEFDDTF